MILALMPLSFLWRSHSNMVDDESPPGLLQYHAGFINPDQISKCRSQTNGAWKWNYVNQSIIDFTGKPLDLVPIFGKCWKTVRQLTGEIQWASCQRQFTVSCRRAILSCSLLSSTAVTPSHIKYWQGRGMNMSALIMLERACTCVANNIEYAHL